MACPPPRNPSARSGVPSESTTPSGTALIRRSSEGAFVGAEPHPATPESRRLAHSERLDAGAGPSTASGAWRVPQSALPSVDPSDLRAAPPRHARVTACMHARRERPLDTRCAPRRPDARSLPRSCGLGPGGRSLPERLPALGDPVHRAVRHGSVHLAPASARQRVLAGIDAAGRWTFLLQACKDARQAGQRPQVRNATAGEPWGGSHPAGTVLSRDGRPGRTNVRSRGRHHEGMARSADM